MSESINNDKVRLGSVGLGWWGGVLADGVAAGDEAVVVSGFARTPETRQKFAEDRGVRQASSFDEMLADDEIEGVLLATSHDSHADMIEAAAAAGKHVFVEKPFTLSVDDGKRAIAAAEKAGVVLQVGHNKRRQPANRRIKQLIDSGELGSIVMVETHQNARSPSPFAGRRAQYGTRRTEPSCSDRSRPNGPVLPKMSLYSTPWPTSSPSSPVPSVVAQRPRPEAPRGSRSSRCSTQRSRP